MSDHNRAVGTRRGPVESQADRNRAEGNGYDPQLGTGCGHLSNSFADDQIMGKA